VPAYTQDGFCDDESEVKWLCTLLWWLCCSAYKLQFLKRMGRLLDNLPERDNSSDSGQCTTPSSQSVSASQKHVDSTDCNVPRSTDVPSLARCVASDSSKSAGCETVPRGTVPSVQSKSTAGELETSVGDAGMSRLIKVSNGYCQAAYISTQTELRSTSCSQFHNVCIANQQLSWSPSATVRQLLYSGLDVSVTRDISPACRPVIVPASCTGGGLYPVTASSISGRSKPLCVTTPSSTGRGGLSAYDSGSNYLHSASSEGLNGLIPNRVAPSHTYNRPVISGDRQQATLPSSATQHSDRITARKWVFSTSHLYCNIIGTDPACRMPNLPASSYPIVFAGI